MSKRKHSDFGDGDLELNLEEDKIKKPFQEKISKHSLDSDEEDDNPDDAYNILHEDDIEGQEDASAEMSGEVRMTAFNMKEEMEEGHFDNQGHFLWKKDDQIQDNWLDSADGQSIHVPKDGKKPVVDSDSNDSEKWDEANKKPAATSTDYTELYKKIIEFVKPKETIAKALSRLGRENKSLSSLERLRRKKAGILDANSSKSIIDLTELANRLLTATGDMDVYNYTYETINQKIAKSSVKAVPEFDMYADDFEEKEQAKLNEPNTSDSKTETSSTEVMWEYKWKVEDKNISGPHTSQKMQQWVEEGFFKEGVHVRKVGEDKFYTSNRIDFELYY